MADILFIADFFADQVPGGGELNNDVLMDNLHKQGHSIRRINSHQVKHLDLLYNKNIIVSNFINLSEENKKGLQSRDYIIYEHDHKYLPNRNPNVYPNYQAPKEHIINREFYANAKAVLCQSNFHVEIVRKNLELDNIVSLGGNLWSEEHFSLLEELSKQPKADTCAIMNSPVPHKNTQEAVQYCNALGLGYVLVPPSDTPTFLRDLGSHSTLVFFPKTPETLSRIVVEARMMGMKTKTTNNIGAIHEEWFSKKGLDLIEFMRYRQKEIVNIVLESLDV
tara:strand:- start:3576 stop:4412 length:837 start_codon:yes stop_codon:yes gene_type:complete